MPNMGKESAKFIWTMCSVMEVNLSFNNVKMMEWVWLHVPMPKMLVSDAKVAAKKYIVHGTF